MKKRDDAKLRLLTSLAISCSASGPVVVAAQEPLWGSSLINKVDSLAEATLFEGLVSGLSVGVKRGDELLIAHGYGFADLESMVRSDAETIYGIGSVTKQFTAAAIMQLAEDGRLSLDDPITRFLPDYPTQEHTITIRHLLTHTSGIPSYPTEETPADELAVDLSDAELRARFETAPLDFSPGERFSYSNSGYVLLGMIISSASAQTYAAYLDEHIFWRLGLARSSYCDTRRITPGRARGYWIEDNELVNAAYLSMTHAAAAGALCSTVLDLLAWSTALRDGRLVSRASYQDMATPAALRDGTQLPYGFGLSLENRLDGHRNISHGGGINGYQTQMDYFPDADLDIVVVSNTNGLHVRRFADMIARWALGIPAPVIADEGRSPRELETYVGVYMVGRTEWAVTLNEGDLFLEVDGSERTRLKAQPDGSFVRADNDYTRMTFLVEGGRATGVSLYQCVPTDYQRCRTLEGARVR